MGPDGWWAQVRPSLARLPSAFLLLGPKGIGKTEFALELASALLCSNPTKTERQACGVCQSCLWMASRQHPDFRWVRSDADAEEDALARENDAIESDMSTTDSSAVGSSESKKKSQEIRIEQIRSLAGFVNVGAHRAGRRVVVIGPANRMNYAAANALLKTLEEPTQGLIFILVANSLRGIPATILSRCARLNLDLDAATVCQMQIEQNEAAEWLMPLLSSGEVDPLRWAERAGKTPPADVLELLMRWMNDVGRVRLGISAVSFPSSEVQLKDAALRLRSPQVWTETMSYFQRLRAAAEHPLNPKLFFETIFIRYQQALT